MNISKNKIKFFFIICLFFIKVNIFAQSISSDVTTTAGDSYENNYANMQVTIGEPIIETNNQKGITISQGFQQTDIIISLIEKVSKQDFSIHIYPNPTDNILILDFKDEFSADLWYELYDNTGKKLLYSKINNQTEEISLLHLISGVYVLKILSKEEQLNMSFLINKK